INYCNLLNPCKNNPISCNPILNVGYTCNCSLGYTGTNCTENNICTAPSMNPCQHGSICNYVATNDWICNNCPYGYNNKNCSHTIDVCLDNGVSNNPCYPHGTCNNIFPSNYTCSCNNGY